MNVSNKIDNRDGSAEKYHSKGFVASIEGGYAFNLSDNVYLQPQAQFTYMGVKADTHRERSGAVVSSNRGNIEMRLGARLYGENVLFNGTTTPYVEVNYFHNTKPFEIAVESQKGRTAFAAKDMRNIYQLEAGVVSKLNQDWKMGGSLSYAQGKSSSSYRDTKVKFELRYDFR